MGKWIALFVLIISSALLGYLYVELESVTSDTPVILPNLEPRALRVFHSFDSGEHRYTGEIKLPHSCYILEMEAVATDPKDSTQHTIMLKSIDRMLDMRLCAKIPTRYPFDVLITAPENIHTSLVIDKHETPIRIIETAWQNAQGKTLTTPERTSI